MGSVVPLDVRDRQPRKRRDPRIIVAFIVLLIGAWSAIVYVGDDSPPPTISEATTPRLGPITSFADVSGTYFRSGVGAPMYFLFFEDGTVNMSSNTDLVVDHPMGIFATTFEGTEVFITNVRLRFGCARPDEGGTYQIHMIPNGNLQFVAVGTDSCPERSGMLLGRRFGITTVQLVPVP